MASRFVDNLTAAGERPFVLLAGAGVSLWHPSSLPRWDEFNTVLLDEARARANRGLTHRPDLRLALQTLSIQDLGSKSFSSALVEILAGEQYFDVIGALDASEPNEAHRAIARLVRKGAIAAIVTTNFDTLIERALVEERVAFDRLSAAADYHRTLRPGCPLFKVHGSAAPGSAAIDTVGQKLRGLPPHVRARLRHLFTRHPVVALGYSGGDLEFGADYLGLGSAPEGAGRIWWVVRPEDRETIEAPVRALVDARGAFVAMTQAEALEALGAGPVVVEWNPATRAARLEDLRTRSRALYAKLGRLNTVAFCMRLLSSAGHSRAASQLWKRIAGEIERRKRQTVPALGPAMRALAAEGHRLFGVGAQKTWACRQLQDIRRRRQRVSYQSASDDRRITSDVRSEAQACLALGDSLVREGRHDEAGLAMQRAMECCEFLGEITLLPGVYRLYGWRDVVRLRQALQASSVREGDEWTLREMKRLEDRALSYLTAAEAAGLVGGNVDAIESAWIRADLLVTLGEYDAALVCLERLQQRLSLGLPRETAIRIETLLGDIDVRQGYPDRAMARWNACLSGPASGNPLLEAYVKDVIVGRIDFVPEWRATVLALCDDLLQAMDRGDLPADGRTDLVNPRTYFEIVKQNLTTLGSAPLDPGFIQTLEWPDTAVQFQRWPAYFVRQEMIQADFEGRTADVLDALDRLVAWQYHAAAGGRALDAATAHRRRADRDGDDDQKFAAAANFHAIRHWLGDSTEAIAWFAEALRDPRAGSPEVRNGLERRLPHALWQTKSEANPGYPRGIELDLDDGLALRWTVPPSGAERERAAVGRFEQNDFVTGRLLALDAIAAFREEGDPGGVVRALELLRAGGARDQRSDEDPVSLCV